MFTDVDMSAFEGNAKFMSIGGQVQDEEIANQNLTTDKLMNAVIDHHEAERKG